MKALTKKYSLGELNDDEFVKYEKQFGVELPIEVKEIIRLYHGNQVKEILFIDSNQDLWILNAFFSFEEAFELTDEFLKAFHKTLLPFAYDPGGWQFCISLEKKDYNKIYVNRWTDHLPEDQFLKIADSLEEFIDGLKAE